MLTRLDVCLLVLGAICAVLSGFGLSAPYIYIYADLADAFLSAGTASENVTKVERSDFASLVYWYCLQCALVALGVVICSFIEVSCLQLYATLHV